MSVLVQLEDSSLPWADCNVILAVVDEKTSSQARVLASRRLTADSGGGRIVAELGDLGPRDRLRIRVEPGARGPIQDRVLLRQAIVQVGPSGRPK